MVETEIPFIEVQELLKDQIVFSSEYRELENFLTIFFW